MANCMPQPLTPGKGPPVPTGNGRLDGSLAASTAAASSNVTGKGM